MTRDNKWRKWDAFGEETTFPFCYSALSAATHPPVARTNITNINVISHFWYLISHFWCLISHLWFLIFLFFICHFWFIILSFVIFHFSFVISHFKCLFFIFYSLISHFSISHIFPLASWTTIIGDLWSYLKCDLWFGVGTGSGEYVVCYLNYQYVISSSMKVISLLWWMPFSGFVICDFPGVIPKWLHCTAVGCNHCQLQGQTSM